MSDHAPCVAGGAPVDSFLNFISDEVICGLYWNLPAFSQMALLLCSV